MMKLMTACTGAVLAGVCSTAFAADLIPQRRTAPAAPVFASPWEFQANVGGGVYAVYNPYGKFDGRESVFRHNGLAGGVSATYRLNDWIAPMLGLRGFVSTSGDGKNFQTGETFGGPSFGGSFSTSISETIRTRSSRLTAFGVVAGLQFGGSSFRVTPYGFVDFVNMKSRLELTSTATTAVTTRFGTTTFTDTFVDQFTAKVNTPVIGAGLKTQYFFTQMFGVELDAWAGRMTRKPSAEYASDDLGRRISAGAKLAAVARF